MVEIVGDPFQLTADHTDLGRDGASTAMLEEGRAKGRYLPHSSTTTGTASSRRANTRVDFLVVRVQIPVATPQLVSFSPLASAGLYGRHLLS